MGQRLPEMGGQLPRCSGRRRHRRGHRREIYNLESLTPEAVSMDVQGLLSEGAELQ